MRTTWTFHTAGRVVFGLDAIDSLGDHLTELSTDSTRVLIVTDPMLVEAGVCERVTESLSGSGISFEAGTLLSFHFKPTRRRRFLLQPRIPRGRWRCLPLGGQVGTENRCGDKYTVVSILI